MVSRGTGVLVSRSMSLYGTSPFPDLHPSWEFVVLYAKLGGVIAVDVKGTFAKFKQKNNLVRFHMGHESHVLAESPAQPP